MGESRRPARALVPADLRARRPLLVFEPRLQAGRTRAGAGHRHACARHAPTARPRPAGDDPVRRRDPRGGSRRRRRRVRAAPVGPACPPPEPARTRPLAGLERRRRLDRVDGRGPLRVRPGRARGRARTLGGAPRARSVRTVDRAVRGRRGARHALRVRVERRRPRRAEDGPAQRRHAGVRVAAHDLAGRGSGGRAVSERVRAARCARLVCAEGRFRRGGGAAAARSRPAGATGADRRRRLHRRTLRGRRSHDRAGRG